MSRTQPALICRGLRFFRPRAALLLGSLTVVVLAATPTGAGARTCKNVSLGAKNSGQTVLLRPCDRVTIRLREAFDGGYQWKVTRRPAASVLRLVSDKVVVTTPKGAVGGTDRRVFVYRAVGKGRTSLKLGESRPFMRHSQIAKFTLFARVK